jgi:hypothetical protein
MAVLAAPVAAQTPRVCTGPARARRASRPQRRSVAERATRTAQSRLCCGPEPASYFFSIGRPS